MGTAGGVDSKEHKGVRKWIVKKKVDLGIYLVSFIHRRALLGQYYYSDNKTVNHLINSEILSSNAPKIMHNTLIIIF